ncbi:MAG TPA: T9SS C-terminal target domain-containing protein, partial [Bacteroidetes bacterium]|nr:T9SS C-terminal target domain-containing protein [Bacteroidota bacterium]
LGREVLTLLDEIKQPGFYETVFDGKDLASGIYFYRIEADQFIDCKKMVLLK